MKRALPDASVTNLATVERFGTINTRILKGFKPLGALVCIPVECSNMAPRITVKVWNANQPSRCNRHRDAISIIRLFLCHYGFASWMCSDQGSLALLVSGISTTHWAAHLCRVPFPLAVPQVFAHILTGARLLLVPDDGIGKTQTSACAEHSARKACQVGRIAPPSSRM